MKIRAGFHIGYDCENPTPMLLTLNVFPSRWADLLTAQVLSFDRPIDVSSYTDVFGNACNRIVAPPGRTTISTAFEIYDDGLADPVPYGAIQHQINDLPDDVLVYLLGSRYCDTDRLADFAWRTFADTPLGWPRVQAILDFTHQRIAFDYMKADPFRTAFGGFTDGVGVCRDYAHLAITLCRCLNIPARYCTGYLGDIGVPKDPNPMDFSAWMEVYLGGRWYTVDARHNRPRIGRILMARGRDATDVAMSTAFGPAILRQFDVVTEEI
ncbi:transglutaminase family protein [Martelella mediterranea]|uniref:transglutaminase-like domain-containing protein n=1 Tax=Martelella mediterranea TaxID=293089 RepID=UPI001E40B5F8|nr:transglutaminase family protein [Martelella mediterranea]MCD1635221.1 transglutaminase family protein [Martelella mediterranea]